MGEEREQLKEILPAQGIWTVEGLANYLELSPQIVQQKLSDFGIMVLSFSSRYKHKLIRLEEIRLPTHSSKKGEKNEQ